MMFAKGSFINSFDRSNQVMATSAISGSEQGLFTAVVKQDGPWWIGWVEEIPGVNSQGHTRDELIENLRSACPRPSR